MCSNDEDLLTGENWCLAFEMQTRISYLTSRPYSDEHIMSVPLSFVLCYSRSLFSQSNEETHHQIIIHRIRKEKELGRVKFRKEFWDCY